MRLGLGCCDCCLERDDVLAGVDPLGVPAISGISGHDVLAECDGRVVLDRDVVVVIEDDQVAELLVRGQRGRLTGDALFHAAIAHDHIYVVIEQRGAGRCVRIEQTTFATGGHGHTDTVGDALAQGPCGRLDAERVPVLGVTGGQ